jgi:phage baseplate assembly protein gpV
MVSPGAGKDRGWFTLPEVGDEVLCAFEHGEIGRPVVLGALWNGKDKPFDNNGGGKNERRAVQSKSGSRLVFDDDGKKLTISDGGKVGTIELSDEKGITFTSASGDCALQCKTDLSICAGEIEIKGTTVDLMGKATGVDASAAASVTIKGNLVALKGSTIDINPRRRAQGRQVRRQGVRGPRRRRRWRREWREQRRQRRRQRRQRRGRHPAAMAGGAGNGGGPGGGNGGGPGGGNGGNGTDPGGGNTPVEERPPLDLHAIEITVVNALDQPAVGVYYELRTPDGRTRTGTTDSAGLIKLDDIEQPGDCQLVFPDIDAQAPAEPPSAEPPSAEPTA